jgi:hypothetical protein
MLKKSRKIVSFGQPKLIIFSDASKHGWGALEKTNNNKTSGQYVGGLYQNSNFISIYLNLKHVSWL